MVNWHTYFHCLPLFNHAVVVISIGFSQCSHLIGLPVTWPVVLLMFMDPAIVFRHGYYIAGLLEWLASLSRVLHIIYILSYLNAQEETPVKVIRLEETNLYASATKALNTALKTTIGLAIFGGLFCMIGGCFGILFAKKVSVSTRYILGRNHKNSSPKPPHPKI